METNTLWTFHLISDLPITSSKLSTGFPFFQKAETIGLRLCLTQQGFFLLKKYILKDDMQISHITHVQMLFEQHLQTINDYVIPTTDILERTRKGKEKGPNLGQAVPCFTQCQPY